MSNSVFEGVKVVELSQGMAGPMAGMLLSDYGASVMKIEPPQGDWARALPGFLMWNRGKRSVVLDLEALEDQDRLRGLVQESDVLVTTLSEPKLSSLGLSNSEWPAGIICRIGGLPASMGGEAVRAYEGVVAARAGRMMGNDSLSGAVRDYGADRPVYAASPSGSYGAALLAVEGITAALMTREETGRGDVVETSVLDGLAATTMRLPFRRDGEDLVPVVAGERDLQHRGISLCFLTVECLDGRFIQMCARQDTHFRNWLRALDLGHLMENPRFAGAPMAWQNEDDLVELEVLLRTRMKTRTQEDWMRIFIEDYDVGGDPFLTPSEFLSHPQMIANERVLALEDAEVGLVTQLGALAVLSETPAQITDSAPKLNARRQGEPKGFLESRLTTRPESPCEEPRRLPLAGVTIVEAAYFIAAPLGTTLLAELGARVIKIEPIAGDPYRRTGLEACHLVAGKESIAVDLKSAEGREILRRVVADADAFLHNFRPGVAERLGMDYESLKAVNPDLVYCYASSYGVKGAQAHRAAFHSTPHALSGGGILQAGSGNPPVDDSYPDPCAGLAVGVALIMALYAKQRFGCGQYVETMMLVSCGFVHSNDLVRFEGVPDRSIADHCQLGLHPLYRLYPCAYGWIFLGVVQPMEWEALARTVGRTDWLQDESTVSALSGRKQGSQLERDLEAIFCSGTADAWEKRLLEAGVPCASAARGTMEQVMFSSGLLSPVSHPAFGPYFRSPPRVRFRHAVTKCGPGAALGEHSNALLAELGYAQADIVALSEKGVVYQNEVQNVNRSSNGDPSGAGKR